MATTSDSAQQTLLTGTPVVPGVAYAPALVVRAEVSPDAIDSFDGSALEALVRGDRFDLAQRR